MTQLLGIDIGTSACKVAVFTPNGELLASANKPYKVYYPGPGCVEQNPEEWWEAICAAIKEVLSNDKVNASEIEGIGIDGQGWSAIPVNSQGNVLANTPIWMDTRADKLCKRIKEAVGTDTIFNIAGNDFLPSYTTPKMIWFKENYPEIYNNTQFFLQSNSYIVYKLTGVFSQDISQGYGIHYFNMSTLSYDNNLAKELGLDVSQVPELYGCDSIVGKVTPLAASLTGLCEGTPVVAGGLDAACGTLGAGVFRVGQTQEQGGQAGGMSICCDAPHAHIKLILGPHVVPGKWLLQGGTVGGGGALRWFKEQFGSNMSFDELTSAAAAIPPGSNGLLFLPYMAGERSPIWNPDAKGVFYGLSYDKTRAHMVRALLEGVAFALNHNLMTAKEAGADFDVMSAMGGAANSHLWTQIKADITGHTFEVPASDTATTLGAAILAGIGSKVYSSYEEAVLKTVTITRVQHPDMATHEIYQKYMNRYLQLSDTLGPVFSKL